MKHFSKQTPPFFPVSFRHAFGLLSLLLPLLTAVGTLLPDTPTLRLLVRTGGLALTLPLAYQAYRLTVPHRPGHPFSPAQPPIPSPPAPGPFQTVFLVQTAIHRVPVPVEEICYFFRDGRHTFLRTYDRKDYLLSQSLHEVEQVLDPICFFRVNRRLVVHYKACQRYKPAAYGKLELTLHAPPPFPVIVSQLKTPLFRRWLQR
ncbi:LytR/AlgR family response regulator transcription factor [Pontibacter actiniarum]|uniref:DNA-binding protein n=1 Tax=Pontibacter actiniarum TaxID=323450 RepID=A0A1X9YSE6_9BACT|nr:LytTR family DNA-binding domain-containing protein [Pontibacter actiniarum]ARS35805.1 DNA-binding protein [Pontibacter actiniarum]